MGPECEHWGGEELVSLHLVRQIVVTRTRGQCIPDLWPALLISHPQAVRKAYQVELDRDLIKDLRSETSGVYGAWAPLSHPQKCACPSLSYPPVRMPSTPPNQSTCYAV